MAKTAKQVQAPASAEAQPARITLGVARSINFGKTANPSALEPAGVVKTAKGENAKRVRVYGYDNGAQGGRVNKAASIAIVPGTTGTPKGVTAGQWAALTEQSGKSVESAYAAGVTARTVRRAYRAGFIRFVA
jgi:hypothetical protein